MVLKITHVRCKFVLSYVLTFIVNKAYYFCLLLLAEECSATQSLYYMYCKLDAITVTHDNLIKLRCF